MDKSAATRAGRVVGPCHRGVAVMKGDLIYYRRRLAAETAAAGVSTEPNVRRIHQELARRYEARVAALEAEIRRAEMHIVVSAA